MSSAPDSIAAGTVVRHYRLVERLGGAAQTWLAEDTRNGNKVALKILTRTLPKDKPSRDAALKQVRLKAAIGHPGLAAILQIDIDQDALWMASELVEGESLSKLAARERASKQTFLRYAWQMADVLSAVHSKGTVLGRITGESWIITPDNDLKFVGMGFSTFMGKHETGQTLISGIKATQLREAAYLSPEQVSGKMVTSKADIFALGVCLYELIEGDVPFKGSSVADVAHAVSTASPPAPKNPAIDRTLLGPIGKCIQKNPDNRYEKIALLKDDLAKVESDIESMARRRGVTSPGGIPLPKKAALSASDAFIVVGELPYHELLRSKDPVRASRLENTMQQYLGEAVYLFDGTVLDSLGPVMVASMPDGESAIKAAQKGLADLVEHNMTHEDEPVEARMLVHFGQITPTAGKPEGDGLTTAMSVLEAMEPLQLLVSKPVIDRVEVDGEAVSIGRLADIDFFMPPKLRQAEPEVVAEPAPAPDAPSAPAQPAATPPPSPDQPEGPEPAKQKRKKGLSLVVVGIIAFIVLGLGAVGAFFVLVKGGDKEPAAPIAQTVRPAAAVPTQTEIDRDKLYLETFQIELPEAGDASGEAPAAPDDLNPTTAVPEVPIPADDPEMRQFAADLRDALLSVVALDAGLETLVAPAEDARTVGGLLSRSTEGIVLTPVMVEGEVRTPGQPIIVDDPVVAALAYVRQVWPMQERGLEFLPGDDDAVVSYLDARELAEQGENEKALEAIKLVTQTQTEFVEGLRLKMNLLMTLDKPEEALDSARRIALLDPDDVAIRRQLSGWEFAAGNPGYGLVWLGELLTLDPENPEILTKIGQYAVAVGNQEKFDGVLRRLRPLDVEHPRLSEGDMVLSRGRLEAAAKKYYEDLNTQPENPVLSLKIGRLAVLRRSDAVYTSELEKLQRLDAPYELAMLQAYIDAGKGDADAAELELRRAEEVASDLDHVYTASAEVYLLLNRQAQVLEALEKAMARAEPTHEYILSNPIFGYLANDPRFRSVLQTIGEQRARITSALDKIEL